jgi:hypothetical protein
MRGFSGKVDMHLIKEFPAFEKSENALPSLKSSANA